MPKLAGSFYTITTNSLGHAATRQDALRRVNWFAVYLDDDRVLVFATDSGGLPTPVSRTVSLQHFLGTFVPDGDHWAAMLRPLLESTRDALEAGGGDPSSLTPDQTAVYRALLLNPAHVPGATAEQLEALPLAMLRDLPDYGAYAAEHRHRLNATSIASRKSGRHEEALELYNAMLRATPDDYHVIFNAARVYFEKEEYVSCRKCLQLALVYAPQFVEARKFLAYVEKYFLRDVSESRCLLRYRFHSPQPVELEIGGRRYTGAALDISSSGLRIKAFDGAGLQLEPGTQFVVSGTGGLLEPVLDCAAAQVVWRQGDICGAFLKTILDTNTPAFKRLCGYARLV